MKFSKITLTNYRNFKHIEINLENKNLFIGENGIGKSNIMHALRILFEKKIRKQGFCESDFFDKSKELEIIVEMNINNMEDEYTKFLITNQIITQSNSNTIYIKLNSQWDDENLEYNFSLYKSLDNNKWDIITLSQSGSCVLDRIFYLHYIYPNIDIKYLFNKYTTLWLKNNEINPELQNSVEEKVNEINEVISNNDEINNLSKEIQDSINKYIMDKININVSTKHELTDVLSNLHLYNDDLEKNINSLSFSDGHKKIISYALINLIMNIEKQNKIPIIIAEEPENNLQLHIAQKLIEFDFVFITSHSPNIVQEFYNLNLIRIYKKEDNINSGSTVMKLPDELNYFMEYYMHIISNAIFNRKIMLVEGYTEKLLYEHILKNKIKNYHLQEIAIINIKGINFKPIYKTLKNIGLDVWVKTDNDFKENKNSNKEVVSFSFSGLNRINGIMTEVLNKEVSTDDHNYDLSNAKCKEWFNNTDLKAKKQCSYGLYLDNENYRKEKLFLSNNDFEEDLYSVDPQWFNNELNVTIQEDAVKKMKNKKFNSLWEYFYKLEQEMIDKIYDHKYFEVLKDISNE